jgi:hypothetical protein
MLTGRAIDIERITAQIDDLSAMFKSAEPWPHLVIDNFLSSELAHKASNAFPPIGEAKVRLARLLGARSHKSSFDGLRDPNIAPVFEALHSAAFVEFIENLTGIYGLEPDPQLEGAGFHQGANGSYLRLHADHNTHRSMPWRYRRVNVMLYLNDLWDQDWNGDLELWDRQAQACHTKIAPVFNRCLVMLVDDTSFHGYGPLRLPADRTRKALAAYYYSAEPGDGQSAIPHPTKLPARVDETPVDAFRERVRRSTLYRIEKALGISFK